MSKQVKKMLSDELRKAFTGVNDVVVVSIEGVGGIENNQMRLALRKKDIHVQVVKNSLAKRLFSEIGLDSANRLLEGPTAVAWGGPTIVELAKEITNWVGKLKKLQIKGGASAGQSLTKEQVTALSKLPSREELLGRVVSLAMGPAARLVSLMNSPAGRIAGQLKTMSEGAPAESAPADTAAAESAAPPS